LNNHADKISSLLYPWYWVDFIRAILFRKRQCVTAVVVEW